MSQGTQFGIFFLLIILSGLWALNNPEGSPSCRPGYMSDC